MQPEVLSWAAVIPAYNASQTILSVLTGIARYIPRQRILLVDDGSTDETADLGRDFGAGVRRRLSNGGKGRALREGFKCVLSWSPDWIFCLDADGQHDPAMIPRFQEAIDQTDADLIIGNRSGDHMGMPLSRQFSNRVSSALLSLRTGMKLPDVQCGFRAIRAEALRRMHLQAENYDIEVEMILQAWKLGCKIAWIPIPTLYYGEPSFMRKLPETFRFIRLLARSL